MSAHRDPSEALQEMRRKLAARERGWITILTGWIVVYIVELIDYFAAIPPEWTLLLYAATLVLGLFGAYTLAESKGYVGRYGAWYLLAGLPFIVWYILARDRWDVSIRPNEVKDVETT